MQPFDAVIIGGGPAGSATACVLARAGVAVAVLERSSYELLRVGETVPPDIQQPLTELGVWDRFLADDHWPFYGNHVVWGDSTVRQHDFIFRLYGRGWHLDRTRFDRLLAQAAEGAGATLWQGIKVHGCTRTDTTWQVTAQHAGQQLVFQSHYLVDATGRRATVARKLGRQRRRHDQLIGLVGHLPLGHGSTSLGDFLLLETAPDGWWYSVPLPGNRASAVFMTDADKLQAAGNDVLAFWRRSLEGTNYTKQRLSACPPPHRVFVQPAETSLIDRPAGPGFLAVGDAAMAFDPIAGQGISKALRSGMQAARVMLAHQRGEGEAAEAEYVAQLGKDFDTYIEERDANYRMETRWPSSPFWHRRRRVDPERMRITLSPRQILIRPMRPDAERAFRDLEGIYDFPHLRELSSLCKTPTPAHQLVAAFKHQHGGEIDDHAIIIALQLLIETALLTHIGPKTSDSYGSNCVP